MVTHRRVNLVLERKFAKNNIFDLQIFNLWLRSQNYNILGDLYTASKNIFHNQLSHILISSSLKKGLPCLNLSSFLVIYSYPVVSKRVCLVFLLMFHFTVCLDGEEELPFLPAAATEAELQRFLLLADFFLSAFGACWRTFTPLINCIIYMHNFTYQKIIKARP